MKCVFLDDIGKEKEPLDKGEYPMMIVCADYR
jgi:hypothetical protein